MKTQFLYAAAILALPGAAIAQDAGQYRCTYGDMVRRVEIYHEPGVAVPCEVHYYKDTEAPGERQVLWRAMHEAGYCESRTEEFIASLADAGWSCAPSVDEADDDASPSPADDTEALTPAETEEAAPR